MSETQELIPKWVIIASALFSIIEIGVSLSLFISPQSVLETVDHSAKGVGFLIYMWAVRQFALGFIFGYATFKHSKPMLKIAYIFLLVMFTGDLIIGIIQEESPLIISAFLMCIVASFMLYSINKIKISSFS